jgi:hypothetical protein
MRPSGPHCSKSPSGSVTPFSPKRSNHMTPSIIRKVGCAILFFVLLLPDPSVNAREARLKDIIVTNTTDDLIVYLTVEGAFTPNMKKAVLSGVPTTFSFFVVLYGTRGYWFDKRIVRLKLTNTVKYHNLKREFVVTRSWENHKPIVVKSFDEAKSLMSEVDNLRVVPLSRLQRGKKYQIRAKAELSRITLPLYLHYVLFFISLWDFETDWYTVDFVF